MLIAVRFRRGGGGDTRRKKARTRRYLVLQYCTEVSFIKYSTMLTSCSVLLASLTVGEVVAPTTSTAESQDFVAANRKELPVVCQNKQRHTRVASQHRSWRRRRRDNAALDNSRALPHKTRPNHLVDKPGAKEDRPQHSSASSCWISLQHSFEGGILGVVILAYPMQGKVAKLCFSDSSSRIALQNSLNLLDRCGRMFAAETRDGTVLLIPFPSYSRSYPITSRLHLVDRSLARANSNNTLPGTDDRSSVLRVSDVDTFYSSCRTVLASVIRRSSRFIALLSQGNGFNTKQSDPAARNASPMLFADKPQIIDSMPIFRSA